MVSYYSLLYLHLLYIWLPFGNMEPFCVFLHLPLILLVLSTIIACMNVIQQYGTFLCASSSSPFLVLLSTLIANMIVIWQYGTFLCNSSSSHCFGTFIMYDCPLAVWILSMYVFTLSSFWYFYQDSLHIWFSNCFLYFPSLSIRPLSFLHLQKLVKRK